MSDTTEKIVDPNLNEFLNKELPITTDRVDVATEEFDVPPPDVPMSEHTKNQILYYMAKCFDDTDVNKFMVFFDKINGLSESQAKQYLDALKHTSNCFTDGELVTIMLNNLVDLFMNPANKKRKQDCVNDRFVRGALADVLNDIFGQIGKLGGVAVFALYTLASWRHEEAVGTGSGNQIEEEKQNKKQRTDNN